MPDEIAKGITSSNDHYVYYYYVLRHFQRAQSVIINVGVRNRPVATGKGGGGRNVWHPPLLRGNVSRQICNLTWQINEVSLYAEL